MTVQDVDEALLDTVCSRLREHLSGDEAAQAEAFARQYYRWVSPDDIAERSELDVYGAALAHFDVARRRTPGNPKVRIYNPRFETHGWRSPHTAVEIVTDDMPFLIDSVAMELNRRGFGVHLIIHPVIGVRRDDEGRLVEVLPHGGEAEDAVAESVIHAEVARQTDAGELSQLERHLLRVIGEVRAAVEDWPAMRARALDVVAGLGTDPPPLDPDEIPEVRAFVAWLEDHNFTFLGARDYALARDDGGEPRLVSVPGSGLGVLRQAGGQASARGFAKLPPAVRARALEPYLLNLTKANSRATVHRPAFLDYVGVKQFDEEGNVVGERRFLGLYTHTAYHASPREIPILRRKVDAVLERAAFPKDSHNEKALLEILEGYPRDELFQISTDDLFRIAMGILHLGERQRMRLFARRDTFDRFLSCLVFVPRDRFNTENRRRIERILRRATGATSIDYTTRVSESVLVRLHYLVYAEPGKLPRLDEREIETLLVAATRSWADDLEEALIEEHGEERAAALFRRYRDAFPPAYRDDWVPRSALADINQIEELRQPDDLALRLYRPLEAPLGALRAKVFRAGAPLALSAMLPLFEDMGVEVADERPYEITPSERERYWIYDFGLTYRGEEDLQTDLVREAFQESFIRVWRGDAESDGYNRLVLRAGLTWHETTVLRAIGRYLRQAGTTFSDRYVEQALGTNAPVARLLMHLFRARFEPGHADAEEAEQLVESIGEAIDAVESLDQDRILRNFLDVLRAMLRTNFFQPDAAGGLKPCLSFKLDPSRLPWLPLPRPRFEIFVYSPRTEGVHLRGGRVARGGIRWSDRREDFRTEVLGLMKAQMVKNAVIVPVGAKGGFVVKQPPLRRDDLPEEVVACYQTFIRGLLDLTDDIDGGEV
ncbi:MAG TPA: NAD-glutamate dehydrogenase domain-containing protein, partial [Thermoleophilaceae bacterium]|nr:NAD-glutamate dehydrogenase domain-containing protein [Thermoleophilaceae bacterium]